VTTQSARDISWVVFDLGGVIVRIHHSWQHAAAAAGVRGATNSMHDLARAHAPNSTSDAAPNSTPHSMFDPTLHRADDFRTLVSEQQRGILSHDDFCSGVSQLTSGVLSAQDVERIHTAVIVGAYDGVEQLVLQLNKRGLSTACLSNTNHQHWQLMHSMAAFNAIQHRHASHLFQLEKPNQAIFRAFESATQARSCDILYFDDLADNIAAATQAGWRAILIDPHSETVPQIRRALATHGVLL
jgi:glucose-1-phosphatase